MPSRRWVRPLAIFGVSLLTLVVAILALLQVPPVATWAMRRLITVIPLNPGYRLEVGRVSGDWLHRLALNEVRLLRNDQVLASIDRLKVGYDLRQLRGKETRLQELAVEGARMVARRQGESWDLANALRRSADTTKGGGFRMERLELRDVQLAAELSTDSALRVRGLDAPGARSRDRRAGALEVDRLNAAVAPPGSGRLVRARHPGHSYRGRGPASIRCESRPNRPALRAASCCRANFDDPRLVDRLDVQLEGDAARAGRSGCGRACSDTRRRAPPRGAGEGHRGWAGHRTTWGAAR